MLLDISLSVPAEHYYSEKFLLLLEQCMTALLVTSEKNKNITVWKRKFIMCKLCVTEISLFYYHHHHHHRRRRHHHHHPSLCTVFTIIYLKQPCF